MNFFVESNLTNCALPAVYTSHEHNGQYFVEYTFIYISWSKIVVHR